MQEYDDSLKGLRVRHEYTLKANVEVGSTACPSRIFGPPHVTAMSLSPCSSTFVMGMLSPDSRHVVSLHASCTGARRAGDCAWGVEGG